VKWLWIVTFANIGATCLLILIIYAILQVIGIAAYTTTWPLFVVLPLVLTLSVIGLRIARKTKSATARWIGYGLNGCLLAIPTLVTLCLAVLFLSANREKYIIPAGYRGDVYIIKGVPGGKPPEKSFWEVTYRIPSDGVLVTQTPISKNFSMSKYYYELRDGTLQQIKYEWFSTIQRTPENLASNRNIGVYFPRSGEFSDAQGCHIEFEEFYVGTKADILSSPKELDLSSYLRNHPAACPSSSK
jgi:hypothetical protein